MKVYKVVVEEGDHLVSVIAPLTGVIKYCLDEETIPLPHCGPLCAFKSLKDARAYVKNIVYPLGKIVKIFEAEAVKSFEQFKIWTQITCTWVDLPGTILCDSITLKKEVTT